MKSRSVISVTDNTFRVIDSSPEVGNSSYRLNFDLGKKNKIHRHS